MGPFPDPECPAPNATPRSPSVLQHSAECEARWVTEEGCFSFRYASQIFRHRRKTIRVPVKQFGACRTMRYVGSYPIGGYGRFTTPSCSESRVPNAASPTAVRSVEAPFLEAAGFLPGECEGGFLFERRYHFSVRRLVHLSSARPRWKVQVRASQSFGTWVSMISMSWCGLCASGRHDIRCVEGS